VTPQSSIFLSAEQAGILSHPEAFVILEAENQRWRVHWLEQSVWQARQAQFQKRQTVSCGSLPACQVIEDEKGVWVAAEMLGAQAKPWEAPMARDALECLRRVVGFLGSFAAALEALHQAGLVWLNFDPTAIEIVPSRTIGDADVEPSSLRLTNLDLQVFPAGTIPKQLHACPAFAAPEVCGFQASEMGPRTDVYHLAIFAYSWLAGLLPAGLPGKGLQAFAFAIPPLRIFAPGLPPGVAQVLAQGLAVEPQRRHGSPGEFLTALAGALEKAETRWASAEPLSWEIGSHTRTGRCKEFLGLENEDSVLVKPLEAPPRALLAVADGVSVCDLGKGGLASWLTCLVLDNSFGPQSRASAFAKDIASACRRVATDLLTWALEKGHRSTLQLGATLMGTTLTAAWLEGNQLQVANVGDSRAYLIDGADVEQLTVDGDVACTMLALGTAPEEIRELGQMGKALHGCIGGVTLDAAGEPTILVQACTPRISHWPLLPGDVIVLCSDGLVDEGSALEAAEMAEIVRHHPELSAEGLAECLAESADARQQPPSAVEPEGFGDNISCVVVKIRRDPHG
jgi:serine/threonine protein phosphatase PrpC